tara:strand:- start:109 stop:462 length:354 start_codon:yes stop_codon:yes gene_type:complete
MSNYNGYAVNPRNGKLEQAMFLDDYYSRHQYAVKFHDGSHYPERQVVVQDCNQNPTYFYRGYSIDIDVLEDSSGGFLYEGSVRMFSQDFYISYCTLEGALLEFKKAVDFQLRYAGGA